MNEPSQLTPSLMAWAVAACKSRAEEEQANQVGTKKLPWVMEDSVLPERQCLGHTLP